MPYFNGQYVVTPSPIVTVNDNALSAPSATPGLGLLVIGPCTDGEPNTPLVLSSPAQAVQALKGGDGLQAALLAFTPGGSQKGPGSVTLIRPEIATQATSEIKNSGATATEISLTTTSYGTLANRSYWSVQAGSTSGYLVTLGSDFVGPGGQTYSEASLDNIALTPLTIYYSGTGTSPTLTVTDAELTVAATTSDTGGTVAFTPTMTVQQLVNAINQFPGWVAVVTDPNPSDLVAPGTTTLPALLDNVSAVAVSTASAAPTAVTANIAAVVNWINGTGAYFAATRAANATSLATSSTLTYATGGTTPIASNSNWQNAYTTAQGVPGISLVTPAIGSASIWAMNDAHCRYMSSIGQARRGYVGDILGQTLADEVSAALALNSNRTSLVWPGSKGTDYNGNAKTFAPYLVAAQVAGARAGAALTAPLTQQAIGSSGLELVLSPAQVAAANAAGIACLMTDENGIVVLSWDRTTWLQNGNYDRVENLTGLATDTLQADLTAVLRTFIGFPITARLLGHASNALFSRLNYWFQQGLITVRPKPVDISLSASGNAITGSVQAALEVPGNYFAITLYASTFYGVA